VQFCGGRSGSGTGFSPSTLVLTYWQKKGTTLQNKQIPPNFETITKFIKQKTQEKFSQEAITSSSKTQWQNIKTTWETTKIHPENKRSQISGSKQVTTVSQHTSIASKSSAITNAQYAN